jgi:hypothetical protein
MFAGSRYRFAAIADESPDLLQAALRRLTGDDLSGGGRKIMC